MGSERPSAALISLFSSRPPAAALARAPAHSHDLSLSWRLLRPSSGTCGRKTRPIRSYSSVRERCARRRLDLQPSLPSTLFTHAAAVPSFNRHHHRRRPRGPGPDGAVRGPGAQDGRELSPVLHGRVSVSKEKWRKWMEMDEPRSVSVPLTPLPSPALFTVRTPSPSAIKAPPFTASSKGLCSRAAIS